MAQDCREELGRLLTPTPAGFVAFVVSDLHYINFLIFSDSAFFSRKNLEK